MPTASKKSKRKKRTTVAQQEETEHLSPACDSAADSSNSGAPSSSSEGLLEEIARRSQHCRNDYATPCMYPSKTLSAALFMFFATLFSTVALGASLQQQTRGRIGLAEYLAMNSFAGIAHSLLGVQPLLVLRPTGPITAIIGKLSTLADSFGLDFFSLLAATGVCVSINMFLIASCRLSRLASRCTPFTLEIFTIFVCSIYLSDGLHDVYARFNVGSTVSGFAVSLLDANLALLTFLLAVQLGGARGWNYLSESVRSFVSDYAVTIGVVVGTAVSFNVMPTVSNTILRIELPSNFSPTCVLHRNASSMEADVQPLLVGATPSCTLADAQMHLADENTTERRPWFVATSLLSASAGPVWLVALLAAVPISFFFFMDQNISRLACEACEGGTARGGRYQHLSFVALGVLNGIGPLFGLPFVTGSLPHSPQFVKALTVFTADGAVETVAESRVAPALVYLLIGLPLLAPGLVHALPEAVIDGVLAYVGYEGIVATTLFERCLLVFTPKQNWGSAARSLSVGAVRKYTGLQLALFGLCWAVNLSPLGLCVAFVVVSLVPLRERGLPLLFSAAELSLLDAASSLDAKVARKRFFDDGRAAAEDEDEERSFARTAPEPVLELGWKGPEAMSVRELKLLVTQAGLSYADCMERAELVARAREALARAACG